ncbi:energy transducer TonB [Paraburkholderia sp. Ac-20347]|uniref:energy transducer TonB n=1 Tax=Paraburkholderia sp. Ac-20347 TaxID=2703892 RepID=UPI0019811D3F|nr:energy transducer TonB [Paraburkholderia sp. Ac-20347]MBN3809457.1 TonB family protein [Paraburkholderia sp. Ac-20347]
MTSDALANGVPDAVADDASAQGVSSALWRRRGIAALVVLAHAGGLYVACHSSRVTLALQGGAATGPSVHVRLVAAPAPRPADTQPAPPLPKMPIAPTARKSAHPVLSSTAPSSRTVQAVREADTPPRATPSTAPASPQTAQTQEHSEQQSQQQSQPQTQSAQDSGATQHAAAPNLLAGPQPISAGELQQLGCQMPRPDYPAKAKRLEQEGTVMVNLVIGTDGAVTAARVAHSSGSALLDAAALAAIRAGRCHPFETAGIARVVEATQPVAFSLNN